MVRAFVILGMLFWAASAIAAESVGSTEQSRELVLAPTMQMPSDYDFVVGDWDVDVTLRRPQGDLRYQARWHNYWLAQGQVLVQEWHGPYANGLEMRSYASSQGHWVGRNIYLPQPATWYENTAKWQDGEMVVSTERVIQEGKPMISREIYFDIGPDRFSIRTERSLDDGKTWQPGGYSAQMTRQSPS